MTIRHAVINDASGILDVIQPYVEDEIVLPIPVYRLYERIRDFVVVEENGVIIGCGSLLITWHDLAEIRSLVIRKGHQGRGVGRRLVDALVDEARELGIAKVFVLTFETGFFARVGFQTVPKEALPHKVWKDCTHCPRFTHCDEIAMEQVLVLDSETSSIQIPSEPHLLMPSPIKP